MRPTVTKKIGLLLFLSFVGSPVGALLFGTYLLRTRNQEHAVSAAGYQRALAAALHDWVRMIAVGQEEDRRGLRSRVDQFDRALGVLQQGGHLLEGDIDAAPEHQPELAALTSLWSELRPDLLTVAHLPRGDARFVEAYGRVETRLPELQDRTNDYVTAMVASHDRVDRQMLWALCLVAACSCAVFFAGLVLSRRYVVQPILEIERAAVRIRSGDLSVRLDVSARDEIGTLARTFNEMTEHVGLAERELRDAQVTYRLLFESSPYGIVLMDVETGRTLEANERAHDQLGYTRDEFAALGIGDYEAIETPEDTARHRQRVQREGHDDFDTMHRTKSGELRHVHVWVMALQLKAGRAVLYAVFQDITERRRAEERTRLLAAALESVTDPVCVTDTAGAIVYVNDAFCRQNGYDAAEVLGQNPRILKSGHTDPHVYATLWRTITAGSPFSGEIVNRRKDGTTYPAELAIAPVRDASGAITHYVCTHRDVTERRELAARMMQMDRMIAVGTLAAGVAHEINNPLSYIVGNLEFVAHELPQALAYVVDRDAAARLAEARQALSEAREGAERVRKIVRDLKSFSRAEEDRRESVSLPPVLESAVNMAWNEIRHRARLCKDYGPVPHVTASSFRLGQVFLNLLVNAAQAIPEGSAPENEIRVVTRTDESGRAVVEVRDTGSGIPAGDLGRIFDPFFTTKAVGLGTGLGLSICRNIVQGLGGEIDVESEVGRGTSFRVILPAATLEAVESKPAPSPAPSGRRGRVLVVDDEPMVAASLQRILASHHDVVVATSGRAGLDQITAGGHFDVVLCDLMMPDMTGMDLHAEVSRRFPELAARMVFLTGGAFTRRAREFLDRVSNVRIEKPFDAQTVRALVTNLIR